MTSILDLRLAFLAFLLEFVDTALGGGFGTILSPLLIIFGYEPRAIVPAVLFSEMCSGLVGGAAHHYFRNVNWRAAAITLSSSIASTVLAGFIVGVVAPAWVIKGYISLLAVAMGAFIIHRSYRAIRGEGGQAFSGWKCALLGGVIGFNKGSTGGGYGPLSVSGYILLGLVPAVAIGTTTVAEGVTCLIGVATYGRLIGLDMTLVASITIGAIIVDPIAAWVNNILKRRLDPPFHGRLIGVAMVALGLITLYKIMSQI